MNYKLLHFKKTIFFRVDGDHGKKAGLGHIYRTLKIYFFLKKKYKKKYNFIFIMKNFYPGKKIIKKFTNEKIFIYKNNYLNYKLFKPSDIFIIDTLGGEKNLIKKIYDFGIKKIISFDEINTKMFNNGLIINGIYFAKKKIVSKNSELKIYQGPKYIILNKSFAVKKKKNLSKKLTILISSGGADKRMFLHRIVKILNKNNNLKLIVLIGRGVKKNNKIFRFPNSNNLKLIKNSDNIKQYFDLADISIVTGGTVMFESIASGKITFVYKTSEHQKYAIKFFCKKNLVKYMGPASKVNKKKIYFYLNNMRILKNLNKYCFKRGIRIIDGNGTFRVNNIIKEYIQ